LTRQQQVGVAAVEFAIVASLLFTVLLGVMEMGRLLWTWNAAVEATRLGARLAAVCDKNDSIIRIGMEGRLPALTDSNIVIDYLGDDGTPAPSCTGDNCKAVRVSLDGFTHNVIIPWVPLSITLPPFATTLRREAMNSTDNVVCK
jgi:hypothetical protein